LTVFFFTDIKQMIFHYSDYSFIFTIH